MAEDLTLELAPEPPGAAVAIRAARAKLRPPVRTGSVWPLVAAAAFAAATALMFAAAVIVGPPQF